MSPPGGCRGNGGRCRDGGSGGCGGGSFGGIIGHGGGCFGNTPGGSSFASCLPPPPPPPLLPLLPLLLLLLARRERNISCRIGDPWKSRAVFMPPTLRAPPPPSRSLAAPRFPPNGRILFIRPACFASLSAQLITE